MATTTIDAVVEKMVSTVQALTPTTHSRDEFRAWDEVADDFRTWADATPSAAFRRIFIHDTGDVEQPLITNTDVALVTSKVEAVIAYPKKDATRYGNKPIRGRDALMTKDATQINHAIGTDGYSTLDQATSGSATVTTVRETREEGESCVFNVFEFEVRYWRSNS